MTAQVKLQLGVAFLLGIICGVAGIITGGTCIACENSRKIASLEWQVSALHLDVVEVKQRLREEPTCSKSWMS